MKKRWQAGCHNASQLWREVQAQGYKGSHHAVRRLIHSWQETVPPTMRRIQKNGAASNQRNRPPSPRQTYWLLVGHQQEAKPEESAFVEQLLSDNRR